MWIWHLPWTLAEDVDKSKESGYYGGSNIWYHEQDPHVAKHAQPASVALVLNTTIQASLPISIKSIRVTGTATAQQPGAIGAGGFWSQLPGAMEGHGVPSKPTAMWKTHHS
jgi:hypothetical protein